MDRGLELRKLPAGHLFRLAQILESGESWKILMSIIPKSDVEDDTNLLKYKMEHIELIERASATQRRRCSEIFLEEWSTSGRKRPDLAMLLRLLVKAHLFRAAEFVAVELLQDSAPARPETGPAASVDTSDAAIEELSKLQLKHFEDVKKASQLQHDTYRSEQMTNKISGTYEGLPTIRLLPPERQRVSPAAGGVLPDGVRGDGIRNAADIVTRDDNTGGGVPSEYLNQRQRVFLAAGGVLPDGVRGDGAVTRDDNTGGGVPSEYLNQRERDSAQETNTKERLMQIQETTQIHSLFDYQPSAETIAEVAAPSFDTKLPHFPYSDLERFTANFCDVPLSDPGGQGRKLGTGAFGSVYLAVLPMLQKVAIKRLNKDAINVEKQFRNEVEALSKFCHPNLLPLLGYCCDGPNYCLVYEYMCNGSLQERLAQKESKLILPWWLRINIAVGTSKGIYHLHSAFEKPLIHRDVKTANILLDQRMEPKLGDFGLVRLGSNGQRSQSIALTTTVFGTSAYMAREAFRGDISVKIDTYSFGVVILELLTGLPPFDEKREDGNDLVTYVETMCEDSVIPLLDRSAGDWGNSKIVDSLFSIALDCLEDKRRRPNMSDVLQRLQLVVNMASNCV